MVTFNCATWSFFPEHNFQWWAKPTSIFLVISFRLERQAWFRVCVVTVVPITFRFIIPLTWCHRRSITSSWNLSTNVSWSSSTFWALPGYQSNLWWEIPSLPLNDLCYHWRHSCLPQHEFVINFGNTSFLTCRRIFAETIDHLLIFPDKIAWGVQVIPDGSFVFPRSNLSLMTMSTLPKSMTLLLRTSLRTMEAQC